MKDIIYRYFRAWLENDPAVIDDIFSDDIVYTECYGPQYVGLSQVKQWFHDWNRRGKVLQWDIRRVLTAENIAVAEWFFRCTYDGEESAFDGVTVADFDPNGRICRLSEYQSKSEHYFPYQT